jgi:hypothetical protein
MSKPAILVVIGASGAGKTTAVQCLEARRPFGMRFFYFDSIGVPSEDTRKRDFGSGEGWQATATKQWISRLANEPSGAVNILEGQTRPTFVEAALSNSRVISVRIVLVECSASARRARLTARGQPELATVQMDIWAGYLRGQADALQLPVIDTTFMSVESVADALALEVGKLQAQL